MNRRQLFRGALALAGAAFLPKLAPCAWHPEGCVGDTCAGKPVVSLKTFLFKPMTPSQYRRVRNLYGQWTVIGNVHDDFYVGYDHHIDTLYTGTAGNYTMIEKGYRDVADRPDHMFLARQTFHGKSWEEAIVYAETYKKWLELNGDNWLQRDLTRRPWMEKFYYDREVEMKGSVADLSFRRYTV